MMGESRRVLSVAGLMLMIAAAALMPRPAAAQAIGSGPLTGTLTETEPTSGIFDLGRVKLAPGMTIDELGWDSNVFQEATDPKDDWVFRGKPDIAAFSLLRWFKVSAYAGANLGYYKTYDSENSTGYEYRARLDLTVARLYPFVGVGHTKHRTRPNGEIDTRADEELDELSGGVAFELGGTSVLYGAASRFRTDYQDAFEDGVSLDAALNRETRSYSAGVRSDVTPITSLTIDVGRDEDDFDESPLRNATTQFVSASLNIGPEAALAGAAEIAFRDMKPVDPTVEPFRGLTGSATLGYSFLEFGRIVGSFLRAQQYSFDAADAYYIETTVSLSYTHRLAGEIDAQILGNKSWFDYGFTAAEPAHTDKLASWNVSMGYNLRNRTRISINYEQGERRSPVQPDRNYDRTRAYMAWQYAF
jgi:hypothetical protein